MQNCFHFGYTEIRCYCKKANVYHRWRDCFKVPLGNEDNVWMTGLLSHTSNKELSYTNFKSKGTYEIMILIHEVKLSKVNTPQEGAVFSLLLSCLKGFMSW